VRVDVRVGAATVVALSGRERSSPAQMVCPETDGAARERHRAPLRDAGEAVLTVGRAWRLRRGASTPIAAHGTDRASRFDRDAARAARRAVPERPLARGRAGGDGPCPASGPGRFRRVAGRCMGVPAVGE
jgi:hypothetical protein